MLTQSHHRFSSNSTYPYSSPVRNSYRPSLEKNKINNDNLAIFQNFKRKLSLVQNIQKIVYSDSSCYEGQLNRGKREGMGFIEFTNGDVYLGEWKDDLFDGKGTYVFGYGDRYDGEVKGGRKEGYGEYFYASGNVYKGIKIMKKIKKMKNSKMKLIKLNICKRVLES